MKKYSTLKDLELLSNSVLEGSLAGFWDWDMVTNEEYLSPRFKEMFGYQDHEMENSPDAWQEIAFKEDLPLMFGAFEKHIQSKGEIPFQSIVRYHHKNGSTIWVRCNGKVVEWSEKGEPLRAIGCHIDITEEKELEVHLKKIIAERDLLLKEVHHRVKNNLQLILSLSRLKDTEGKIDMLELEDSINSIALAYEAIYTSDRLEQIPIRKYLNQVIGPSLFRYDVELDLESIDLKKNIDFLIPIGLIVTELINNSLKHAFTGISKKKIHLSVERVNEEVLLKYQDNGKGYEKEVLNSKEKAGSFGLSIVKSLVEQLNGEVNFYNDKGASTQIRINPVKAESLVMHD